MSLAARARLSEARPAEGLKAAEMLAKMCGWNEPERVNVQSVEVRVDAALIEQLRAGYAKLGKRRRKHAFPWMGPICLSRGVPCLARNLAGSNSNGVRRLRWGQTSAHIFADRVSETVRKSRGLECFESRRGPPASTVLSQHRLGREYPSAQLRSGLGAEKLGFCLRRLPRRLHDRGRSFGSRRRRRRSSTAPDNHRRSN